MFKKIVLSFHCITLIAFCQLLLPLPSVSAVGTPLVANISHDSSNRTLAATSYEYNNFHIKDFTGTYYLYRDTDGTSRMIVTEQITAVFPSSDQNHGITRVIPFTNNNGKNLTMNTGDTIYIDVERNGIEEPVNKVEVGDGYYNVYIGDADKYVHGEQVYTLSYAFENIVLDRTFTYNDAMLDQSSDYLGSGVDHVSAWQELYWDTNGNDWEQRFDKVTAKIFLDEAIADSFNGQTACYVGRYGATNTSRCKMRTITENVELDDGETFTMSGIEFTASSLSRGENLTFVMGFDEGTFATPPLHFDYRLVAATVVALVGAAAMIFLMAKAWIATAEKRRYYKSLFTKPEYTPLPDITVGEMAGNYIGKGLKGDAKVATLLDMAVRHKIELVKSEQNGMFGKKKTTWTIRIKTDTMSKQQATVLKILAGSGGALKNGQEITIKSHTATSELQGLLKKFNELVQDGLIRKNLAFDMNTKTKNGKKPTNWSGVLIICTMVWFFAGLFAGVFVLEEIPPYLTLAGEDFLPIIYFATIFGIFLAAIITTAKTSRFVTHTNQGLEASKYLEGLKMYMEMAEADRLKMFQSVKGADTTHEGIVRLYEKLLPYAILFKLEESWLKELARYYEFDDVVQPEWYVGVGVFSAHDFSAAMIAASHSVSSTITHSTTTSSSSGSSGFGGGFSGGGGGGGGGGGW